MLLNIASKKHKAILVLMAVNNQLKNVLQVVINFLSRTKLHVRLAKTTNVAFFLEKYIHENERKTCSPSYESPGKACTLECETKKKH